MTTGTQPEFVPDLPGLLAAALPARGLDDLLGRLAGWWQRATAADEVVIVVTSPQGERSFCAQCSHGQPPQLSSTDGCGIKDVPARLSSPAPATPADAGVRVLQLTDGDRPIGAIKLIRPPPAETSQDWIAATSALLVHSRSLEVRLRDEKLSALAEFAAGAGHEINNPLATILICAQRLQRTASDPEQRRLLATIGGQALRVRDMIGDVMLFARPPAPELEVVELSAAVADVLGRFNEQCASRGIAVEFDGPPHLPVQADPTQLRVVISELLSNAIEAQPGGGRIEIACLPAGAETSGCAVLKVVDAGSGLDETARQHLFDPFYSGRAAGRGLGFGLSKVWRIVGLHGGRIDIAEPPGGGLAASVHWPIAANSH